MRRLWLWFDDLTGLSRTLGGLAHHPVPPGTGWMYVLGSATLVALVIQVVTGTLLATTYIASSGDAYDSLKFITEESTFGHLLRGLHYFGASAMVILIGMHVIRVYLTGSYKFPRQVNWLSGAALLLLTMIMGFTGQLLRWDQDGVWSAVIAAEQAARVPVIGRWLARFLLGGDTVGGATLTRFFAFHVFLVPGLMFAFVGVHLYLVIRNGISEPPRAGHPVNPATYRGWYEVLLKREGRPFWPDVAWRDVVFGVLLIAGVAVLALTVGPPVLGKPPDPTIVDASPRPDWYLLWYFALLALLPHALESYVIILGPLAFGLLLIALPLFWPYGERSPIRRPWAIGFVIAAMLTIGSLWVEGRRSPWSPDFAAKPLPDDLVGATSGPIADGAAVFFKKGCEYCHEIGGYGGHRGPALTDVADRLTRDQMTWRILNGATDMPSYASNLTPADVNQVLAFLQTRVGTK
jgi:ubiquinol-cytochrome c reductase cytochrome b subunit